MSLEATKSKIAVLRTKVKVIDLDAISKIWPPHDDFTANFLQSLGVSHVHERHLSDKL